VQRAYTDADSPIPADPQQLRQVFLNLLLNSLQAMGSTGGTLTVTTAQQGAHRVVRLQDTGCGMSPAQLSRAGEPFFTTKPTGTGLGLAVVQAILREHQGRLTLTSHLGQGTTVEVTLPVAVQEPVTVEPPAEEESHATEEPLPPPVLPVRSSPERSSPAVLEGSHGPSAPHIVAAPRASTLSSRPRLLIVDDDEGIRAALALFLEDAYDLIYATTGEEALRLLGTETNTSAPREPAVPTALAPPPILASPPLDLILLDIKMPELDGLEVLRHLRQVGYRLPILMLTAYQHVALAQEAVRWGATGYLPKPFERDQVLQAVREALGVPSVDGEL
jgi:CheY-like chemotaxis protein